MAENPDLESLLARLQEIDPADLAELSFAIRQDKPDITEPEDWINDWSSSWPNRLQ